MQKRTVAHVQRPHHHPHPHSAMFYRPDSSYYYFPRRQEEQHKQKRYVFYGQVEFTEKERKYLQEYKKFLAAKKLTHTPYVTDQKIVLFLHEKEFKVEHAYKALKEHEDWRQQNLPVQLTPEIQQLLESGIIYMCGRDNRYRPIVVMNLRLFDEKRTDLIIRTFTYFFEEIIEHVLLPGQVEQWVTIMDVEGFSLFSLPLGVTGGRKLLNHLETHYRGRLYRLYLVNSPSAVWLSWKIVKQFLEDSTVDKVDIVSDNKIKKLYKHAHLSQLEKKFGGTQENKTVFWPGNRPIEEFLTSEDNPDKLHVTKQQYRDMNLVNNIVHPSLIEPVVTKVEVSQAPVEPAVKEVIKLSQKVLAEEEVPKRTAKVASIVVFNPKEEVPEPQEEVPKPKEEVAKPVIVEVEESPSKPVDISTIEVKVGKQKSVPADKVKTEPVYETLIVEPPAALGQVKDIERDREDKVDNETESKKEQPDSKPPTDQQPEVKPPSQPEIPSQPAHTTVSVDPVPTAPPAVSIDPVPAVPAVPVAPAPLETKPPTEISEPVVIAPPEPLPPVAMVDVREDKIHGEDSHIGAASKYE